MNSSYFKTLIASIGGLFHQSLFTREPRTPVVVDYHELRRGLSSTKKYASTRMRKIHARIGSKTRGAVQLREQAVGVHWRQA